MSAALRELVRPDLDRVLDVWERLQADGHAADPRYRVQPHAREAMRAHALEAWFGRFLPFPVGWVAEDDGAIVGYLVGLPQAANPVLEQPPTAMIQDMWVAPSHRRRGVGRRLVERFVAAAAEVGYPQVAVGTLALDARAVGFWKAMGFGDWRVTLLREA